MEQDNRRRALDALEILQTLLLGHELDEAPCLSNMKRRTMLAHAANNALAQRKRRCQILGQELASEPCWEILLTLYANWAQGSRMSVTDLAHETGIPSATVVRWLSALVDRKLVCREPDRSDGRRIWLGLTREAQDKVEQVLTAQTFAAERLRAPMVRAA